MHYKIDTTANLVEILYQSSSIIQTSLKLINHCIIPNDWRSTAYSVENIVF